MNNEHIQFKLGVIIGLLIAILVGVLLLIIK